LDKYNVKSFELGYNFSSINDDSIKVFVCSNIDQLAKLNLSDS